MAAKLSGLDDFIAADAGSAGAQMLAGTVHNRANTLQVHVPTPIADVVGVTDFMTKLRTFAAYFANSCHFLGTFPGYASDS